MKKLYLIIIALICCIAANAYTAAPSCPDFTDINASYVEAFTGNTHNPFTALGVVSGRHTLITQQGTDPNTGGALNLLPPGESQVVRLGNQSVGAQAEALSYHFIVDRNNPVLLLKFAVVLEDPNHNVIAQPRFVVRITDSNGNLTESCAEYDVSAGAGISGFQTYNRNSHSPVRWRDWTNVGLDLSAFIGREVQVQFITYDCLQSGHFGYAYFTASCISNTLQLQSCGADTYTVEAPEHFASYQWENGDQTRTTTRPSTETDRTLTCTVTSVTGCQFTLFATVTGNNAPPSETSIAATICEGEAYTENGFNIPPQMGSVYNTYLNPAACNDDNTVELALTVVQRYTHIRAAICRGQNYTENGFNIIQPTVGVRRDTLALNTSNGLCEEYLCLELTIGENTDNLPDIILGDNSPCTNNLVTYQFEGIENLYSFEWNVPDNFTITGRYTAQITGYSTIILNLRV